MHVHLAFIGRRFYRFSRLIKKTHRENSSRKLIENRGSFQAIHAEPNPCPDRHLFVFDFANIINPVGDGSGQFLPSTEIPEEAIIDNMRPLADRASPAFRKRLEEVIAAATGLLPAADRFPGGRAAVEALSADLEAALS